VDLGLQGGQLFPVVRQLFEQQLEGLDLLLRCPKLGKAGLDLWGVPDFGTVTGNGAGRVGGLRRQNASPIRLILGTAGPVVAWLGVLGEELEPATQTRDFKQLARRAPG
jgi:hypothetical protein